MRNFKILTIFSFIMSLAGPVTLIVLYAQALLRPEEHAAFIFQAGIAIFFIEFLTIHSSGMLLSQHKEKKKKVNRFFLLGFYAIFTIGFMFKLDCWFIGLYFLISLCAKVFISRSVKDDINKSQIAFSVINLLGCTFVVIPLAPLLKKTFPIAALIISEHADGQSGLFVDTPQTLLVWGILYFSFTVVFNIVIFFKHSSRSPKEI